MSTSDEVEPPATLALVGVLEREQIGSDGMEQVVGHAEQTLGEQDVGDLCDAILEAGDGVAGRRHAW
jgi:hypothetical protein